MSDSPAHVEGQSALYRVRAALDPTTTTPTELHTLVSGIMRTPGALSPDLALLTRENRAHVAAAALTGWARHRPATSAGRRAMTFGGVVEHHVIRRHEFTVRAELKGLARPETEGEVA